MMILLLGCTAVIESQEPEKGSYLIADESSLPDIALVESRLQQAVDQLRLQSAHPFVSLFVSLMEESDSQCPRWYSDENGTYWFDSCTSTQGTLFEGYGTHQIVVEREDEGGNRWNGNIVHSASLIESQSGEWLSSTGHASLLYGINTENGADIFSSSLSEGFSSHEYTRTPQISMWASRVDSYQNIHFDAVRMIDDAALVFNQNLLGSHSLCPEGSQSIQTDNGWVQVFWSAENCSGCSSVFFEGQPIGEVCIDFSDWLDWSDNPWGLEIPSGQ